MTNYRPKLTRFEIGWLTASGALCVYAIVVMFNNYQRVRTISEEVAMRLRDKSCTCTCVDTTGAN